MARSFRSSDIARAALLLSVAVLAACRTSPTTTAPAVQIRPVPFPWNEDLGTWRVAPVLSPDGRSLAFVRAGTLRTVAVDSTGDRSYSVPDSFEWCPTAVTWHPDGRSLLALERHRLRGWRISLTEIGTGERRILSVSKNGTKLAALSPDARHVALVRSTESWDERDELRSMELTGGAERVLVRPERGAVISSLAWSPDGGRVAFVLSSHTGGHREATIEVARLDGSREVVVREEDGRRLTGPTGTQRSMVWLHDGRLVYCGFSNPESPRSDTELRFVEVDSGNRARGGSGLLFRRPGFVLEALSASADSVLLVIARTVRRGTIDLDPTGGMPRARNASSGPERAGASPPADSAGSVAVPGTFEARSPDGRLLATRNAVSDSVEILDAVTRAVRRRLRVPGRGIVQAARWAPDGRALYASGVLMDPRYWIRRVPLDAPEKAEIVWSSDDVWAGNPVPSRDGRTLTFETREYRSELWRMELPSR